MHDGKRHVRYSECFQILSVIFTFLYVSWSINDKSTNLPFNAVPYITLFRNYFKFHARGVSFTRHSLTRHACGGS